MVGLTSQGAVQWISSQDLTSFHPALKPPLQLPPHIPTDLNLARDLLPTVVHEGSTVYDLSTPEAQLEFVVILVLIVLAEPLQVSCILRQSTPRSLTLNNLRSKRQRRNPQISSQR